MKFLNVIIAVALLAWAWDLTKTEARNRKTPQQCIEEMFSDPDRFDPSNYFEIKSEDAPPFPEAIKWINENLDQCLNNRR